MAATSLERIRTRVPNWPEPVDFRDQHLEHLDLTMDDIRGREDRYVDVGQINAKESTLWVTLGDWYKMLRWPAGFNRKAARSIMMQNEIIMAHKAAKGDGTGMNEPLYPGTVLSHIGAIGTVGARNCDEGHSQFTATIMKWFVENNPDQRIHWPVLYKMLNEVQATLRHTRGDHGEARPWIEGMLSWMSVLPPWLKVSKWGIYAIGHQVDPGNHPDGATHYGIYAEQMAFRHRALRAGDLVMVSGTSNYTVQAILLSRPREFNTQWISSLGPWQTIAVATGVVTGPLEEAFSGENHWVDGQDGHRTLTGRACIESECPGGLSSYSAYVGTILRTLTDDEADRVNAMFNGMRGMLPEGDGFPVVPEPEPVAEGEQGEDDDAPDLDLHDQPVDGNAVDGDGAVHQPADDAENAA